MSCSRGSSRLGERGAASIEFAAFALAGLLLLLAGTDLSAYLRGRLRLDQVSGGMANLVTSHQDLYAGDFPILFQAAQQMAGSLAVTGRNGATVITGIINRAGSPVVAWRQQAGNDNFTSLLGPVGGSPRNLPDDYALPAGSSVVAVEVFSAIDPWVLSRGLLGTAGSPAMRSVALYQPRSSLLSEIAAGVRP